MTTMTTTEFKVKRAWTNMDKSTWGPGLWQHEPDRVFWLQDGLACVIQRTHLGALCGYVGVPPGHACHGMSDSSNNWPFVNPHGGVTWTGEPPGDVVAFLCDLAVNGQPLDIASWWFIGFDCAHAGDISPAMVALTRNRQRETDDEIQMALAKSWPSDTYKDVDYVLDEVNRLREQIAEAEKHPGYFGRDRVGL